MKSSRNLSAEDLVSITVIVPTERRKSPQGTNQFHGPFPSPIHRVHLRRCTEVAGLRARAGAMSDWPRNLNSLSTRPTGASRRQAMTSAQNGGMVGHQVRTPIRSRKAPRRLTSGSWARLSSQPRILPKGGGGGSPGRGRGSVIRGGIPLRLTSGRVSNRVVS